jgi:hypothetical protein
MSRGMDEKGKEEREFSQDIDRILARKETSTDEVRDDDYRSNIDFAGKIIKLRGEPSPAFQEALKKHLLSKLAVKEAGEDRHRAAASFWDWLRSLIPRSPVWRTAAITVTVVALAVAVVWRIGLLSPEEEPIVTGTVGPRVSVEARAETPKAAYAVGEEIDIDFFFKNVSGEILMFSFPPEIGIENMATEIVRTLYGGQDVSTPAPGASVRYRLTWDQKDDAGKQVSPGDYQIIMQDLQLGEGKGVVSLVESPILTILPSPDSDS